MKKEIRVDLLTIWNELQEIQSLLRKNSERGGSPGLSSSYSSREEGEKLLYLKQREFQTSLFYLLIVIVGPLIFVISGIFMVSPFLILRIIAPPVCFILWISIVFLASKVL